MTKKLETRLQQIRERVKALPTSSALFTEYVICKRDRAMLLEMVEFLDQEIKSAIKAYNIKLYNHHEHLEKIMEAHNG